MRLAALVGIAALAMSATDADARTRDLWLVTATKDSAFFIDMGSHRRLEGDIREVWEEAYEMPSNTQAERAWPTTRTLTQYDCGGWRSRFTMLVVYTRAGEVERSFNRTSDWSPVIPGSVGEALLEFACASSPSEIESAVRIDPNDVLIWATRAIQDAR